MAGHSKWANIQHRKGKADKAKAKLFSKLAKEITVAARLGGGDPAANPRLRAAVVSARAASMPTDTIDRAIKKGSGELEGVDFVDVTYEGYGPGGVAIMLECLTDNRNRTVSEIRSLFSKNGGHLGAEGSVAFLFKHCGQLVFAPGTSEDQLMNVAIEAGAEDVVINEDGSIEVITTPTEFHIVKAALERAGLKPELAEVTMKPANETLLTGEDATRMQKLIDAVESLDDVQEVYTTAVMDQE